MALSDYTDAAIGRALSFFDVRASVRRDPMSGDVSIALDDPDAGLSADMLASLEVKASEFDADLRDAAAQQRIDAAKRLVARFADSLAEHLTTIKPQSEMLGWDAKQRAAYGFQNLLAAGASEADAIAGADRIGRLQIERETARTGESLTEITAKIIANAEFFAMASGEISGISRETMRAIDALGPTPTQDQLDAVVAQKRVEAEQAFAELVAVAPST